MRGAKLGGNGKNGKQATKVSRREEFDRRLDDATRVAETDRYLLNCVTANPGFRGSSAWAELVYDQIARTNLRLAKAWMRRRNDQRLAAGVTQPGRRVAIEVRPHVGAIVEFVDSPFRQAELAFA